jgi:ferritin
MINKKIEDAINQQIANEAYASSSYLSMASWCEITGLRGAAAFFYQQSDEERVHMLKMFKYINEAGGHSIVPVIKEPPATYKSIDAAFEIALKQEQEVTKQINKLVDLSLETKDYASFHFLQWFVEEQLEEERLFRTILDVIKLGVADPRCSLLLIDNEIAKIRGEEAKAE